MPSFARNAAAVRLAEVLNFPARMGRWSIRHVLARVDLTLQVARERRQLAELDDRMLKDIGLSRSLAHLETERSPLDLPKSRVNRLGS